MKLGSVIATTMLVATRLEWGESGRQGCCKIFVGSTVDSWDRSWSLGPCEWGNDKRR